VKQQLVAVRAFSHSLDSTSQCSNIRAERRSCQSLVTNLKQHRYWRSFILVIVAEQAMYASLRRTVALARLCRLLCSELFPHHAHPAVPAELCNSTAPVAFALCDSGLKLRLLATCHPAGALPQPAGSLAQVKPTSLYDVSTLNDK
jgi:hypothetical protein